MLLSIVRHGCRGCTRPSASTKERLRQLGAMVVVDKSEVLEVLESPMKKRSVYVYRGVPF
jgi:hypothetical protein